MSISGPFPMSEIDFHVPAVTPGTYILSREGNAAHYVGRSDTDLANRLRSHLSSQYVNFWYQVVTSAMQAYYLECEWYHKYHPADNQNHPAVPPGAAWKCPVAGCPWG